MNDGIEFDLQCPFWYLSKFQGERKPQAPGLTDLQLLQADLANPQCVEIIVGGQSIPTQVWRK